MSWAFLFWFWLGGVVLFGAMRLARMRRRAAQGSRKSTPIFDILFGVVLPPIAVLIVLGFLWDVLSLF